MGLNIKNEHVHNLAREAARLTGRSQTSVIELALEKLLRDLGADPAASAARTKFDLAVSIAVEYSADDVAKNALRSDHDLYDEQGLPR